MTRDFDFVIAHPGDRLPRTIALFYDRGFELVSHLNDREEVIATIASRKVAAIRLRLDAPASAYFFNAKTGLRVDLLFDFPIPAAKLAEHATRIKIRSQVFDIASDQDLLHLKRIAQAARSAPGDAEDMPFSSHAGSADAAPWIAVNLRDQRAADRYAAVRLCDVGGISRSAGT